MRFPRHTIPTIGQLVLAFVTAEGNAHLWVIAVFDRPPPDLVRQRKVVVGVKVIGALGLQAIGRIEKHSG